MTEPKADDLSRAAALLAEGRLDDAAEIVAGDADPRMRRIAAYVFQEQGRLEEARAAYEAVLRAFPEDWESYNNLGNVLVALGRFDEAAAAFEQAIRRQPDRVEMVFNLSNALAQGERHDDRQRVMRIAAGIDGGNAEVQTELGLAEAAMRDFEAAERAFREAIRLNPRNASAYLELGLVLENLNRTEALSALSEQAAAAGLGDEAEFLVAWALRREGKLAEALAAAEAVPETINPVRRAQLLAELYDRVGRPADAFAAFEAMNRAAVDARPAPAGPTYRAQVSAAAAQVNAQWVAGWSRIDVEPSPPAPIFIVGFPRSGTTLLDTLLMNLPELHVLEELPVLAKVEAAIAPGADYAVMSAAEARLLRDYYFELLGALSAPGAGQRAVDKHPLHMARMPLIQRVFPDASIVLVERHPCDAVLSCFMANFQLNHAMRSFTALDEAARTYDAVFDAWTRAETLLPLNVHRVRYERMVEDLESEMRALLGFLGRDWDPAVLDNQGSAAARGHVRTASYSQVGEPIYKRAAGRWQRYRAQLAPVLPMLAPWAARMDYDM